MTTTSTAITNYHSRVDIGILSSSIGFSSSSIMMLSVTSTCPHGVQLPKPSKAAAAEEAERCEQVCQEAAQVIRNSAEGVLGLRVICPWRRRENALSKDTFQWGVEIWGEGGGRVCPHTRHHKFSTMHHVGRIHVVKHADSLHVARDREEELTGPGIKPCGKQDFGTHIPALSASRMHLPNSDCKIMHQAPYQLKCQSARPAQHACAKPSCDVHKMFARHPGVGTNNSIRSLDLRVGVSGYG